MGTKTPVSILQEMMVRKGYTPVYELIHDGCGTHQGLFKYQVRAGTVSAIGSGHSKKEAKHDTAKRALERIRQEEEQNSIPEQEEIGIESPYHNKLQENAVGQLQEVCLQNNIVMPDYKLIADEGPPHCKQFTIMCQVNKFREIGVGRTKKQAKQLAALEMVKALKPLLGEVPESIKCAGSSKPVPSADVEKLVESYKEVSVLYGQKSRLGMKIIDYTWELKDLHSNEEIKKLNPSADVEKLVESYKEVSVLYGQKSRLGMKIIDYTWELKDLHSNEEIKKLNNTKLEDIKDPQETLQKILDEIGAKAHYHAMEGKGPCHNRKPDFVCHQRMMPPVMKASLYFVSQQSRFGTKRFSSVSSSEEIPWWKAFQQQQCCETEVQTWLSSQVASSLIKAFKNWFPVITSA